MSHHYEITAHRQRAGRMNSGGYTAEITGDTQKTSPRFNTSEQAADWAQRYIDAQESGRAQQAAEAVDAGLANRDDQSTTPTPAKSLPPQRDRQADRVARMTGLPTPQRSTGRCHYCGLPLTNSRCEECV